MSDEENDELRAWMKSNGVWHKGLYNMLDEEDVETLYDFECLPLLDVIYIIDDAKEIGFPYATKLKQLHGGFPKNVKRESTLIQTDENEKIEIKIEQKNDENEENDNNILNGTKPSKVKKKKANKLNVSEQHIDIEKKDKNDDGDNKNKKNKVNVTKPSKIKKKKSNKSIKSEQRIDIENERKNDDKNVSDKLNKTKPGKIKRKKSKKSNVEKVNIERDAKDLKMECRPQMEGYLRSQGIWQIDVFHIITDEYNIYSSEQLQEVRSKEDEEWKKEFILKAKRCGMMSPQSTKLEIYFGIKKPKKKQRKNKSLMPIKKDKNKNKNKNNIKKSKSSTNLSVEAIKSMDPKERENTARNKMEPCMIKNGFWQKDLFLILLEYDVFEPKDLKKLSKSDRKEIITKAKQRGTMGQKIKKFKAYFV